MRIKTKVVSLAAIVAGSLAIMAIVVNYQMDKLHQLQDSANLAMHIEANMLKLRRHEKDFLARKDSKYHDKFQRQFAQVDELFAELKGLLQRLQLDD